MVSYKAQIKKEEEKVRQWNSQYPAGTKVNVVDDFKDTKETVTTSEAWVLGSTAVIMVKNKSGAYMLDRVSAI